MQNTVGDYTIDSDGSLVLDKNNSTQNQTKKDDSNTCNNEKKRKRQNDDEEFDDSELSDNEKNDDNEQELRDGVIQADKSKHKKLKINLPSNEVEKISKKNAYSVIILSFYLFFPIFFFLVY